MRNEYRKRPNKVQRRIIAPNFHENDIYADGQWDFHEMPYSLQNGRRGERVQIAICAMGTFIETLDETMELLQGACE